MNYIYWIIEYLATLTEWFLCLIFCGTFIENTDLKQNFLKKFIVSNAAAILIMFINRIELYSPLTILYSFLIESSMQLVIYFKSPIKAMALGASFFPIVAAIDNIVVSTISYTIEIPANEIYRKMSMYRVLAIISSKIMLLLVVVIINKSFSKKKLVSQKYLLILFSVTMTITILTVLMTFADIKNKSVDSYVSILFFVVMFILLMIIFFGTFKLAEYYENRNQLRLITLKNQMLEQSMAETEQTFMLWKTSLHDFKHNIMNLMSMAENNDIQGIKQYLEKENDLLGKKLFYYKTGNETVDVILNIKQKLAEDKGITFIINAEVPKYCRISSMDFSSLLGNLLDNAIEASEKEAHSFIEVNIKSVKEHLIINILNKYTGYKYTGLDSSLKTTKIEKHMHGIGIHSVKQTVKKYNGEFYTEISDNTFNVKIMIPI